MSGVVRAPKGARLAASRSRFRASRVTEALLEDGLRAQAAEDGWRSSDSWEPARRSTETHRFPQPAAAAGPAPCPRAHRFFAGLAACKGRARRPPARNRLPRGSDPRKRRSSSPCKTITRVSKCVPGANARAILSSDSAASKKPCLADDVHFGP
jgi:hypothetical protein